MSIKPEELQKSISKALEEWADVTEEAAIKGLHETASASVEKLRAANPPGEGSTDSSYKRRSWNDYDSGWTLKHETAAKRGKTAMIVHNAKHYQLTHLLENGHALRDGGRSRAFPHIAPVAEEAEKELLDNIKKYIQ